MSRKSRPLVGIVGGGKVGQALGRLLHEAGYPIGDIACRSLVSARAARRFIGAGTPRSSRSVGAFAGDVLLFTTPDDALAKTAEALSAARPSFAGIVALHTSGALDASALEPLARRGAAVGSMHPLQSFSTPALGVARVPGSAFAIEGSARAITAARALVRAVDGRAITIRAGAKPLYHAAAVMAAGHVAALVDASLEAMRAAGMSDDEAVAAVFPLILGTLDNVRAVGTAKALTGPFARGDEGTIARNRAALAEIDERLVRIYDLLGERSRSMARTSRTPTRTPSRSR